jgi:hypothetical protein
LALSLDILRLAQLLILGFGGVVIYYAYRSYSRSRSKSILLLGIGFAFVTIGAVAAGFLFEFMNVELTTVEAVQALSQAVGFFIIVYSLVWTKE